MSFDGVSVTADPTIADALAEADAEEAVRPDEPSLPLGEWMKKNLFSSPANTVLTVIFSLIALGAYRGVLNFIFSENTTWDAVRVNLRLLFTQAYPEENYTRVWVAVGLIFVLTGISLGLAKVGPGVSMKKIATWFFTGGAFIAIGVFLREASVLKDDAGDPLLDADLQVIRESFGDKLADRTGWLLIAAVLLGIGAAIWFGLGDLRRRSTFVPGVPLALGVIGLLISSTWWYNWGHYAFTEGEAIFEPGRKVASTTRIPWTILWFVLVGVYVTARSMKDHASAGRLKAVAYIGWFLSPFITYWVILRGPVMDWGHVFSTDLPLFLLFGLGGGAFLWALTRPGIGELGRLLAIAVVGVAIFTWIAAFFGWFGMLQKVRLSFLFLGLAGLLAPNFIGEARQRLKLVYGWIAFSAVFHALVTVINTPSSIEVPSENFAGGFMISIYVSVFTMIFSFPLGVLLALARTSKLPLFRMMSTVYIESFRGVPLITMLFFFTVFVNLFLPEGMELQLLAAVTIAFTLFSAAYLAENVRGGLQAIRRGQYEASDALGLTTVQRTSFIVLPQGLRVSIPPLVGQAIGTYKETSLLAIVGVFDFLRIARDVIPNQPIFLGIRKEGLLFISVVYFIGAYAMSKYSQRLEKQLGVGER